MLVFHSTFSCWPFWQVFFHVVMISLYCFILSTAGCNQVIVFTIHSNSSVAGVAYDALLVENEHSILVWKSYLFSLKTYGSFLLYFLPFFFSDTKFIFAEDTSTVNTKEKVTALHLLKGHEWVRRGTRGTTRTPHRTPFLYSSNYLWCSASSPIPLSVQKSFSCNIWSQWLN